ncbi:unnamed protein product, partial [Staurois parvus]
MSCQSAPGWSRTGKSKKSCQEVRVNHLMKKNVLITTVYYVNFPSLWGDLLLISVDSLGQEMMRNLSSE